MSTTFQTASPKLQKLDPLKRVNYTFGLVLGVEEFLQSDTYFLAKHHLENRLLHGYGTVCGLNVTAQMSPQPEVQVAPGWAINPKGQEICVPQLMCVQVNDWLQANLTALKAIFPTAPATLNLCVVLCYRECKTDVVPIPGEPCQTQSSPTAPSRILDSFELKLCLDADVSPPLGSPSSSGSGPGGLCEFRQDAEGGGVRAFAELLSEIQASATGPFLTIADIEQLVRDLAQPVASPPLASPPAGPPWYVPVSSTSEYMRAAFRTWITEVRPFVGSASGTGTCCAPPEKCVLLAEVVLSLSTGPSGWSATAVTVDDSRRPFLVPTSLLQDIGFQEAGTSGLAPYSVVAAGYFSMTGSANAAPYGNLSAVPNGPAGDFLLNFRGYQNPNSSPPPGTSYIVKGTVQDYVQPTIKRATFEFVDFEPTGIRIRILSYDGSAMPGTATPWGFMVEISEIGGAP